MGRRQETKDDKRGNNRDRLARKIWMLTTAKFGGNGHSVDCVHCHTALTLDTVQADRIIPGASYRRTNVQPACGGCNRARGANRCWGCPLLAMCPPNRKMAVAA